MFGFCPLASGSKGNSLYLGTSQTRILIDAGIPALTIFQRLSEVGVDPKSIEAIFITHEHSDHVKGLAVLSKKLKIPIIANAETVRGLSSFLEEKPRFKIFTTGESFSFKDLVVHPFSVPHDTLDPVGFTFEGKDFKLGICADIGHVTSLVRKRLENCDYLYLEANHQVSMVHASPRPAYLKNRILGKQGHLSNEECGELILSLMHPKLKHVYLAHLSGECNAEEVALKVVEEILERKNIQIELSIAYQEKISKAILFQEKMCTLG